MALTISGNNLSGIYSGQTSEIEIGDITDQIGPFFIGTRNYRNSVNLKAFFDPSISPLAKDGDYNKITIMQTGWFDINYVSVSEKYHLSDTQRPIIQYGKYYYPLSQWMDICSYYRESKKVIMPFYPYWILSTNSSQYYDTSSLQGINYDDLDKILYKYPQPFGGFTQYKITEQIQWKQGDNLCAFMDSHIDLNLGDIPNKSAKWEDFLKYIGGVDNLKAEQMTGEGLFTGTTINVWPCLNYLENTVPKKIPINSYCIYPAFTETANNFFIIKIQENYRYNFRMTNQRKKNWPYWDKCYAIVFVKSSKLYFAYLDIAMIDSFSELTGQPEEGVFNLYDSGNNSFVGLEGEPDINKIKSDILREFDRVLMDLDGGKFRIGYNFYTFACHIDNSKIYQNKIDIKLFDGFTWKTSRIYDGEWKDATIDEIDSLDDCGSYAPAFIKPSVEEFFKYHAGGIQVSWL